VGRDWKRFAELHAWGAARPHQKIDRNSRAGEYLCPDKAQVKAASYLRFRIRTWLAGTEPA